ncbi:hypothetical protein ACI1MP_38065 (plasmid) [Kitasatospora griseola]|uniref:hypothetical protein n=1 Tax=Kitasatospora griseola TaxID=2064 RepID=UPI0038558A16
MYREWPTHPDPINARHRVRCERPFRYLEEDEEIVLGPFSNPMERWAVRTLSCPVCLAEEGLDLTLIESADPEVMARCPDRHEWSEPRLDRQHFIGYSRFRYLADPDTEWAWLTEAGYGEEPAPPVDYWAEGREATVYLTKYFAKRAKRKIKAQTTGRLKKAVRTGRKRAGQAVSDRAAALRARIVGEDDVLEDEPLGEDLPEADDGQEHVDVPPYAAYRDALDIPAPKRGPRCLVCEDSGRITAPGVDIPCTECTTTRPKKTRTRPNGAPADAARRR